MSENKKKIALVTGASRGLGAALAIELSHHSIGPYSWGVGRLR
jgi:NAD(P)-dependent dehydrogenase (short-subunit alcohol dehydrogenase family)